MSLKNRLGKLLLLGFLEVGALCGAAIRPEQIEEIMKMSQPAVTYVVRNEDGDDDPPRARRPRPDSTSPV